MKPLIAWLLWRIPKAVIYGLLLAIGINALLGNAGAGGYA